MSANGEWQISIIRPELGFGAVVNAYANVNCMATLAARECECIVHVYTNSASQNLFRGKS